MNVYICNLVALKFIMKLILKKSDTFGAIASTLCMIHCFVTPFIFLANTCIVGDCGSSPSWWKNLDYIFLIISFFAVHSSSKKTSKEFMKTALWFNWTVLFLLIINEKLALTSLPETFIYVTAISLAVLHIYNLKYCQCDTDGCCN